MPAVLGAMMCIVQRNVNICSTNSPDLALALIYSQNYLFNFIEKNMTNLNHAVNFAKYGIMSYNMEIILWP